MCKSACPPDAKHTLPQHIQIFEPQQQRYRRNLRLYDPPHNSLVFVDQFSQPDGHRTSNAVRQTSTGFLFEHVSTDQYNTLTTAIDHIAPHQPAYSALLQICSQKIPISKDQHASFMDTVSEMILNFYTDHTPLF